MNKQTYRINKYIKKYINNINTKIKTNKEINKIKQNETKIE